MAHQVNLDALIPREDFDVLSAGSPSSPPSTFGVRNLEAGDFAYSMLRKPDFQRETSDWPPDRICGFIRSFLEGDLIPALILWKGDGQIFVIDGAHRLSALIAWVHDDYGDGATSKQFFEGIIPDEQVAAADYTRRLVRRELGSYADHQFAIQHPEKTKPELLARARSLGGQAIQLQWVQGDARKAEASFFKINQQAAPIDTTELRLLKARTHPNALAARAIIRSGTGHKYWSRFPEQRRDEIEAQAKAIYELLFSPALKTPIKTLDLPVAGRGYSSQTLPLVFEFVNLANGVKKDAKLAADATGDETLRFLKACRSIVNRIAGTHASSLGLHPAVYFYAANGRYQPTAFLAVATLMRSYEEKSLFGEFTRVRRAFEDFLLKHRVFVNQVTIKQGSGAKGAPRLLQLFEFILDRLKNGEDEETILAALTADPGFSFLQPAEKDEAPSGKAFSSEAKSTVFLNAALQNPNRCAICGGLIHSGAITIDHIHRKADGGLGDPANGQLAHPYCNTTYKN